MTAQSNKSIF